MSTRAAIGMKQPDGKIWSIYVHNNGFVAGVGVILAGWYDTRKRVNALLKLGALSSLGKKLKPNPKKPHSFAHPQPNVTVAYHRDRSETLRPARAYRDMEDYRINGKEDFCADYVYLYDGGKWFVYGVYGERGFIEINVTVGKEEK